MTQSIIDEPIIDEAIIDEDRSRHPAARLVARIVCAFPNGERRHLYVTRLSPSGAFVLALRPPRLGAVLTLRIEPAGHPAIDDVEALVIGQRVDPGDAERSGFEVLFTRVSESAREALQIALAHAPVVFVESPAEPRRATEQRRQPRVETLLQGVLALQPTPLTVDVVNLSLSGALLGLGSAPCPLQPGDVAELSIVAPTIPETVSLNARVVRLSDRPRGLGVCFLPLEARVERRIEGLIIDALGRHLGARPAQRH